MITQKEVQRAKDYLTGVTVLDMEDSQSVALFFARKHALDGKIETIEDVLKRINQVTLEDVHHIANRLLMNARPYFAVIGPYEDSAKFSELMQ